MTDTKPQQTRALIIAVLLLLIALPCCRKEPKHPVAPPPPEMPASTAGRPLRALLPPSPTAVLWLDLAAVRRDARLQRVWQQTGLQADAVGDGDRARLMGQAAELLVAWYGLDGSRPLRLLRGPFVPALAADAEGSGRLDGMDWRVWSPTEDLLAAGDPELVLQTGARIRRPDAGSDEPWRTAVDGGPAVARAVFVADPAHALWLASQIDYKEVTDRAADVARIEASATLGLGLDLIVTVVPTSPAKGARAAELVAALLAVAQGLADEADGSGGSGEQGTITSLVRSVRVAPPDIEGRVVLSLELSGAALDGLVEALLSQPPASAPAPPPAPAPTVRP